MKRIVLTVLLVLLVCGVSWAKENIVDQGYPNIWSVSFNYDHRQVGANVPYFSWASGDYFLLNAMIKTGGALVSYDDIMGVKATHSPTGYEYNLRLAQNCVFWPGAGENRQYSECIRPEGWMYGDKWTIELKYKGELKEKHVQYREISMIKPYALTTLQHPRAEIISDGQIRVSWSAQGVPAPQPYPATPGQMVFDYRVLIYDMTPENMGCPDHQINGNWRGGPGWFDPATWRVNFLIPPEHAGKPIRMETRALVYGPSGWIAHRATFMTVLP